MDLGKYTQAEIKSIFGENDGCTLPWASISSACLLTGRFHEIDFHSPMWVLHLGWCHMQPLGPPSNSHPPSRGCYISHFQQPWALHSLWELKLLSYIHVSGTSFHPPTEAMTPVKTTMGHPTSLPPLNDSPPPLLLSHPTSLPHLDDSPPPLLLIHPMSHPPLDDSPPPLNDSPLSLELWLEIWMARVV